MFGQNCYLGPHLSEVSLTNVLSACKCNLTNLTTEERGHSSCDLWFLDVSRCSTPFVAEVCLKFVIVMCFFGDASSYFASSSSAPPFSTINSL